MLAFVLLKSILNVLYHALLTALKTEVTKLNSKIRLLLNLFSSVIKPSSLTEEPLFYIRPLNLLSVLCLIGRDTPIVVACQWFNRQIVLRDSGRPHIHYLSPQFFL